MRKSLLFISSLFAVGFANAQSVGIGTVTPNKNVRLSVVGVNTDSSLAAVFDGNALGQGVQVIRGGVGIGPFGAISQLTVSTDTANTGIDAGPAIIGYSLSETSASLGGVYGTYDSDAFYGVGVQGVGYEGVEYANLFGGTLDVGVYGSATVGVMGISTSPEFVGGVQAYGNAIGLYAEATDLSDTIPDEQMGIYATATGSALTSFAGFFEGDVQVTGNLEKGAGTFKIDHPLDPANKYLYHSFVESPDMMNIYNGNITTDANGIAVITMPDYFDALNKDFRYQLTAIGTFAQAIVKNEINGNQFTIQTNQPNVKVSWQVTGVRKDKYAEAHRVKPVVDKESFNKGFYVHAKEWGLSSNKSIAARIALKRKQTLLAKGATIAPAPLVKKVPGKRLHRTVQLKPFTLAVK